MNVKGTAVRARLRFLEETFGADLLDRVLAALSKEDRQSLDAALPTSWIPVELVDRLDLEIVRHGGGLQIAREYGAFSARRNLSRVYKAFLDQAAGDPQLLLESLVPLHQSFYDQGRMRVLNDGQGTTRIEIDFAGNAARFRCQVSLGFVEEALRMLGLHSPRIHEDGCQTRGAEACTFDVRWESADARDELRASSAAPGPLPTSADRSR